LKISPKTETRALWALLVAALVARLLYCFCAAPYDVSSEVLDISWYDKFARSLVERGGLFSDGQLSAVREPGYPVFLGLLYAIFGYAWAPIWIAQSLLGTAIVWGVFLLGRDLFSKNVAWLAAGFAAFYPQFIFYTATPERETLQVAVVLLAMILLVRALRQPSVRSMVGAGLAWAMAPLVNSALLPAAGLMALGVWLRGGLKRPYWRWSAVFLAAFIGLYALWPLRNFVQFGRFIPGVTAGGAHIYISLIVPNDAAGTAEEVRIVAADPVMQASKSLPADAKDRYFYHHALHWVGQHPGQFVGIMVGSLVKLWRLYPYQRNYGQNYRLIKIVALLSDGWLIPLGFVGLFLLGFRLQEAQLLHLLLFAITFTYMVFWAIIRYRLPMMPYVMLFAAYAVERALRVSYAKFLPFTPTKA
jgi:4-amino-4-deoxy-L-arabinose transferase-like glycosyltransferase